MSITLDEVTDSEPPDMGKFKHQGCTLYFPARESTDDFNDEAIFHREQCTNYITSDLGGHAEDCKKSVQAWLKLNGIFTEDLFTKLYDKRFLFKAGILDFNS